MELMSTVKDDVTLKVKGFNPGDTSFVTSALPFADMDVQSLGSKTLSREEFVSVAERMTEIVSKVHKRGLVHFDVSLANFIISSGAPSFLKLIEFGRARHLGETMDVVKSSTTNTAPETRGNSPVFTDKSDVWQLGMCFYTLWTNMHNPLGSHTFLAAVRKNAQLTRAKSNPIETCLGPQEDAEKALLERNCIPFSSTFPESLKMFIERLTAVTAQERPTASETFKLIKAIDVSTPIRKNTSKVFDRKRYLSVPENVAQVPLVQASDVIEKIPLDSGRGGQIFAARLSPSSGLDSSVQYALKECKSSYACQKEVTMLTLLRGLGVASEIVAKGPNGTFYVMELLSGTNLRHYYPTLKNTSLRDLCSLFKQMADLLETVHQKDILHLDLGLGNWFISNHTVDSRSKTMRIIDFGHARLIGDTAEYNGYPPATSPELRQNLTQYTPKADIWTLGMVYYSLTTALLHPMSTNTIASAIKKNAKVINYPGGAEAAVNEFYKTNTIPFSPSFPPAVKSFLLQVTCADSLQRPSLQSIQLLITQLQNSLN
jgi:serine/threonine protein kinase